jgi:serine/threonine protein kinase
MLCCTNPNKHSIHEFIKIYANSDLKPENVLIDAQGYPVIIDFGFAKYVLDKTFTLCGTPLYIAPEVILNRGHNYGADHWSLGCLIYEMLTGRTPFYEGGMDQSALFKAIVKGVFPMARGISNDAQSILLGLLTRNPNRRLGCPATHGGNGNFDDILYHPWLCTIDHEALLLKDIPAPSVPKIKDPFDRSNFDDWSHVEDKRKVTYPKLKQSQELLFEGF